DGPEKPLPEISGLLLVDTGHGYELAFLAQDILVIRQGQRPSTVVRELSKRLVYLVLHPADLAGGILLRIGPRHAANADGSRQAAQRVWSRRCGLMTPPRLRKGEALPARPLPPAGTGEITPPEILEPLEPLFRGRTYTAKCYQEPGLPVVRGCC